MNRSSKLQFNGSIDVSNAINTLAIFGFYCAILLNRIIISNIATFMWYGVAIVCALLAFFSDKGVISNALLLFFSVCWMTGALNIAFVGNYSLRKLLFALMSIAIARLMLARSVNLFAIKLALYLNILYVLMCFATRGLFMNVYASVSNNYISIQIIQCVVIYYALAEAKGERLDLKPAVIAFVITVASQGRGGIVSMGAMVIGLLICHIMETDSDKQNGLFSFKEIFFGIAVAVISLIAIWLLFNYIRNVNPEESVFRKFHNLGMSGNGRMEIWGEYFNIVSKKLKFFLLGGRLDLSPLLQSFNLNLHNSFLEIHAYNGIIMLTVVLCMLGHTIAYGIRNRKPILIICLITICLRGFFDQMLWATTGMPFFVFFLIYPLVIEYEKDCSKEC